MGVEALTRVFEHAPHDGMELLVLIALANIADAAGVCWPGHEYLGLYARVKHERNLRQYRRIFQDFLQSVESYCRGYGLGCTQAPTEVPFDQLILQMMRAAGAVT